MRAAAAAAFAVAVAASPLVAQSVVAGPLAAGDVTFVFHSTFVGRLLGRAPIERATFDGARLQDVRGTAEVLVARMETGNGARDRHMRETLQADSYPVIRFAVDSVTPGGAAGDTVPVALFGKLTLHGVTQSVRAQGTAVLRPDGTDVTAGFALDMRDYGVRPPVRALMLHVAPDVVVTARLSFGAARSP